MKFASLYDPYLSASEVVFHEEEVYVPLPLPVCLRLEQRIHITCIVVSESSEEPLRYVQRRIGILPT